MKSFFIKHGNLVLKLVVVLLLSYGLYIQIFARDQLGALWAAFLLELSSPNLYFLYLVVFLMPLNWALEALKWQTLLNQQTQVSLWPLFKGVLGGVTVAMFTPNRMGEHGGRILFVEPKDNWAAFVSGIVGSFSQMLVLISFGILGLVYFATHFLAWEWYLLYGFLGMSVSFILMLYYFYFRVDHFFLIAKHVPGVHYLKPYAKYLHLLKSFSQSTLLIAIGLSTIRYFTYTFQYYLMLRFFGLAFPLLPALAGIASIFLFQTSVPLPPVIGLVARGELAIFIWNNFETNEISILGASFALFVINLSIPALLGLLYIIKINILKSLGYEHQIP